MRAPRPPRARSCSLGPGPSCAVGAQRSSSPRPKPSHVPPLPPLCQASSSSPTSPWHSTQPGRTGEPQSPPCPVTQTNPQVYLLPTPPPQGRVQTLHGRAGTGSDPAAPRIVPSGEQTQERLQGVPLPKPKPSLRGSEARPGGVGEGKPGHPPRVGRRKAADPSRCERRGDGDPGESKGASLAGLRTG